MKSSIQLILTLLMFSACAVSVRDKETPVQEGELPTMSEVRLKEELQGNTPDSTSLSAFNRSAKEKLMEFFELSNVIANPEVDEELRNNALQQAAALFEHNNDDIIHYDNSRYSSAEFLRLIHDNEIHIREINNVQVIRGFEIWDDDQYRCALSIHYLPQLTPDNAKAVLKQTTKQFGEKEQQVWEVYLSSLEFR